MKTIKSYPLLLTALVLTLCLSACGSKDGGQAVDAPVTPQLRELVQRLENASSNAKVSCLILRDGQLTLALQTRYVFAGIPPELDMRDIDGIRGWFTTSLTGMGGLLDILQESPALTGAEK